MEMPKGPPPPIVWSACPECGVRFSTSVKAIADGRDICRKCYDAIPGTKSSHNLINVSSVHFNLLYTFFLSFYAWWVIRSEALTHTTLQAYAAVYMRKESQQTTTVEYMEWRALNALYSRYGDWLTHPTERNHNRLYYALWQMEGYYQGTENPNGEE